MNDSDHPEPKPERRPKPPRARKGKPKPNGVAAQTARVSPPTIDRSAAPSAKGPRLQKLRAALFILEAVDANTSVQVYAGVEVEGDAFVTTADANGTSFYSEENKNYATDSSLTFVSDAVLNSVVIFIDTWITWRFSTQLRFGLYTTATIGKERLAGRAEKLCVAFPSQPIVELLRTGNLTADPALLPAVKTLVLDEYESQYSGRTGGYLDLIKNWNDSDWTKFFSLITWLFAEETEDECERRLVKAIRDSRFFDHHIQGRESLVVAGLLELFDKRQLAADFAQRFVHASDVELLFRQVSVGEIKRTDPTWTEWEKLPSPIDQRNVGEKLRSACPRVARRTIEKYQRKTSAGLAELQALGQDKSLLALQWQVYDACADALDALAANSSTLTEAELESRLEALFRVAIRRVEQRCTTYGYSAANEPFVRNLVLTLFDSCFLALDEAT